MISCMPPLSSKKRSAITRSCEGTAPRTERPAKTYRTACSAPPSSRPHSRFEPSHRVGETRRGIFAIRRRSCQFADLLAQRGDLLGKFRGAGGRFATPEGHVGRSALGVFDEDAAGLHAADAPGSVAEKHDVAGQALDGEVFVHRANDVVFGRGDHGVEGVFRNGAAAGDGREAAAAPCRAGDAIHAIAEQDKRRNGRGARRCPRRALSAARRNRRGAAMRYGYARRTRAKRSSSRHSSAAQAATICWASTSSGASGMIRRSSSPRRTAAHQRGAFDQFIARGGEDAALGDRAAPVAGAADALQGHGNRTRASRSGRPRSTVPMSIPSSSDAVATSTRTSPALSLRSAARRSLRARLPWCAATASVPRRSPR